MFRSLRLRIALSHALVLSVILIALGGVGQALLARELDASVTHELQGAADGAAERIEEAGHPVPPPDSDIPSRAGEQLAVYAEPNDALIGEPAEVPNWLQHYPDPITDLQVEGEHVRVVMVPATIGGTTVAWVAAGRSMVAEDRLLHRVRLLLLVGGGVAILASLAAGWWLAGRAVRAGRARLRGAGGIRRRRLARAPNAAHVRAPGRRGAGREPSPSSAPRCSPRSTT